MISPIYMDLLGLYLSVGFAFALYDFIEQIIRHFDGKSEMHTEEKTVLEAFFDASRPLSKNTVNACFIVAIFLNSIKRLITWPVWAFILISNLGR